MRMNEPPSATPRLLVIDDDNDLRLFLQELLTEESYVVDVGATLSEALALIDTRVYHLIITDLLAHSSTDPLRSALAILGRAQPTPVAALTGWNISAAEVTHSGLARLILKPFDINELLTTVAECLETRLSTAQRRQAEVVRRFWEAFNASDLTTCLAACADDVRILPPDEPSAGETKPIVGLASCRDYLEMGLRTIPGIHLDEYLIHPLPRGLALRYVKSWPTAEQPGGRATLAGMLSLQFRGQRISQITST